MIDLIVFFTNNENVKFKNIREVFCTGNGFNKKEYLRTNVLLEDNNTWVTFTQDDREGMVMLSNNGTRSIKGYRIIR